jgi:hypothetical protein
VRDRKRRQILKVLDRERLEAARAKEICDANEYSFYVRFPTGSDACIARIGLNYAILADITEWGYGDRWCFSSIWNAMEALAEWSLRDGEGEPQGWHRHPDTGRRRENGDAATEYVNF